MNEYSIQVLECKCNVCGGTFEVKKIDFPINHTFSCPVCDTWHSDYDVTEKTYIGYEP